MKNWAHVISYAAALNQNDDWSVWDIQNHYSFCLDKEPNDLVLPWPSAMKASISSTVRGTHVSNSIPLAVTAMSSSIRTCHREHAVTNEVFQLETRSTLGSDGRGSTRCVSSWVADKRAEHRASTRTAEGGGLQVSLVVLLQVPRARWVKLHGAKASPPWYQEQEKVSCPRICLYPCQCPARWDSSAYWQQRCLLLEQSRGSAAVRCSMLTNHIFSRYNTLPKEELQHEVACSWYSNIEFWADKKFLHRSEFLLKDNHCVLNHARKKQILSVFQLLFCWNEKYVPVLFDSNLSLPVNVPTQSFPIILSEKCC